MVERAIEQCKDSVELELEDNNKNIKNIPVLVINDNIVSEGKVLTVREITKYINCLDEC